MNSQDGAIHMSSDERYVIRPVYDDDEDTSSHSRLERRSLGNVNSRHVVYKLTKDDVKSVSCGSLETHNGDFFAALDSVNKLIEDSHHGHSSAKFSKRTVATNKYLRMLIASDQSRYIDWGSNTYDTLDSSFAVINMVAAVYARTNLLSNGGIFVVGKLQFLYIYKYIYFLLKIKIQRIHGI